MLRFALFFGLGAWLFHQLAWLPDWRWLGPELIVLGLLLRRRRLALLALLGGFAWSHGYSLLTVPSSLPGDSQVMRLLVSGRVVSLPERTPDTLRFVFAADRVDADGVALRGSWRLRLSWRNAPAIGVGEVWRLPVRVRAVHGFATPGAWDFEGALYRQGIRYRGYVSADSSPRRLGESSCCRLTRLRAAIGEAIDAMPASGFARGVVRAVTIGDTSGLGAEDRELFRATGTSHLMAISGLHIGLLAGLAMMLVGLAWRALPMLGGRVPARVAGGVAGLLLAIVYAALAGMGLPTQRAVIMLMVFAVGLLMRRQGSTLPVLAAAAICVLSWHPPSIVSAGFWLSFVAVVAIIAALVLSAGRSAMVRAVTVQMAISLALWPVLQAFDMPASGAAPLINLVLVPVFGIVIVPLALLGAGLLLPVPAYGAWILHPLSRLLDLVRDGLVQAAALSGQLPGADGLGLTGLLVLVLAVGLILSPPGMPLRWLAVPLLAVAWLPREPRLATGSFDMHLLDVGQGLSTVVETRNHALVFDTGPEYPSGFSTAEAVLVPFLRTRGVRRIDRLVLSHGDLDHAGGISHLLGSIQIGDVVSGEPERVGAGAGRCIAGDGWQWDGVSFEFLHPAADHGLSGNNASCVLRVSNAAGSVLFTGDIGERVERQLGRGNAAAMSSRIVVAPHHGSRSSSGDAFIAATRPSYVLYSAGWANRYGFPAADVVERWRQAGAVGLNTAVLGAISFHFPTAGEMAGPVAHRERSRRFWKHDSGSAGGAHAVSFID